MMFADMASDGSRGSEADERCDCGSSGSSLLRLTFLFAGALNRFDLLCDGLEGDVMVREDDDRDGLEIGETCTASSPPGRVDSDMSSKESPKESEMFFPRICNCLVRQSIHSPRLRKDLNTFSFSSFVMIATAVLKTPAVFLLSIDFMSSNGIVFLAKGALNMT